MGIRKSTRIENYRMIHVWSDDDIKFVAEASKHTWPGESPAWLVQTAASSRTFDRYQGAVDWVMDEYRLAKSGRGSWEELAAEMAGDMGFDWEDLPDDTQQDFIDAARSSSRLVQ